MNLVALTAAMEKDSGLDMDLTLRMQILEAALNRPPGEFSKNRRAIGAAMKELPLQYPDIDPEWFLPRDYGFYETILAGVRKVLKKESGILTPEEFTQDLLGGITPIRRKQTTPLLRRLGKNQSSNILNGSGTVKSVKNTLYRFAQKQAFNVWEAERTKERQRGESGAGGAIVQEEDQMGAVSDALETHPFRVMLHIMDSPSGRKIKNWLYRTIEEKGTPIQVAVLDAQLHHPNMGPGELANTPEILDTVGVTAPQNISNHLRRVKKHLQKEFAKPVVQQFIMDQIAEGEFIRNLERGRFASQDEATRDFYRRLRLASLALRVASRWLHL